MENTKKVKVCLIHPQNNYYTNKMVDNTERGPHLGLGYIAAYLQIHNVEATIIDGFRDNLTNDEIIIKATSEKYDIYGLSLYNTTFNDGLYIIKGIKKCINCYIILGGHFATFNASELLKKYSYIDCVIKGEGEETFLELCEKFSNNEDLTNIPNLVIRDRKTSIIYDNECRPLIQNLDKLPFPANNNLMNMVSYIIASRGCYGNCSFCSIQKFYRQQPGNPFRCRSVENVVDELEYLVYTFKKNVFTFNDDNFFVVDKISSKWTEKFVTELKKRQLLINFTIKCRPNDICSEKIKILKTVGLKHVSFGVESAVPSILKRYRKNIDVNISKKAIVILIKEKVSFDFGFILFDPFLTLEDFICNMNFFKEIKYWQLGIYNRPISLFPELVVTDGTDILNEIRKNNLIKDKNNYFYTYYFKDTRVQILYDYFIKWRELVNSVNKLNLLHLYTIEKSKKRILNLSKEFFYIDYEFLYHLSMLIKDNSTANKLDDLYSLYSNNLILIRNELIGE